MKENVLNENVGNIGGDDTTKRLMSSPKCRNVEVINKPARPGSNHREVNCINYNNKKTTTTITITTIIIIIVIVIIILIIVVVVIIIIIIIIIILSTWRCYT